MTRDITSLERDRALVSAMRLVGEPIAVIDDFLMCLDLSDADRDELRRIARQGDDEIATGDILEMNPLTSQPQRSRQRGERR